MVNVLINMVLTKLLPFHESQKFTKKNGIRSGNVCNDGIHDIKLITPGKCILIEKKIVYLLRRPRSSK